MAISRNIIGLTIFYVHYGAQVLLAFAPFFQSDDPERLKEICLQPVSSLHLSLDTISQQTSLHEPFIFCPAFSLKASGIIYRNKTNFPMLMDIVQLFTNMIEHMNAIFYRVSQEQLHFSKSHFSYKNQTSLTRKPTFLKVYDCCDSKNI